MSRHLSRVSLFYDSRISNFRLLSANCLAWEPAFSRGCPTCSTCPSRRVTCTNSRNEDKHSDVYVQEKTFFSAVFFCRLLILVQVVCSAYDWVSRERGVQEFLYT